MKKMSAEQQEIYDNAKHIYWCLNNLINGERLSCSNHDFYKIEQKANSLQKEVLAILGELMIELDEGNEK